MSMVINLCRRALEAIWLTAVVAVPLSSTFCAFILSPTATVAWHERNYRLIVKVAERLPQSVLQEDAGLLMYYDNALMRAESEPEQGRLL